MIIKAKKKKRKITYPLHPETAAAVHHLEELLVLLAPEKVEASYLEIGPKVAHVIFLALHGLRVKVGQTSRLSALDLLGQFLLLLFRLRLDKHLPEALRLVPLEALVGGRVAENVGNGLAQFLDRDGEAVCLIVGNHFEEWIT